MSAGRSWFKVLVDVLVVAWALSLAVTLARAQMPLEPASAASPPGLVLRLSTLEKNGSDGARAAEAFAREVEAQTHGRVRIKVYPSSLLGDWPQVYENVIFGWVDLALQPVAIPDEPRLAITWMPYAFEDYTTAERALTPGGPIFDTLSDALANKGLTLLGVYGEGMGGAGFTKPVAHADDPNASRNLKVRVWPGATTHKLLLERLGFKTATLPWADLGRSLDKGTVDGQIGGTASMALENFKAQTRTWIQYNDHFEANWLFVNSMRLRKLSAADQQAIRQAALQLTKKRFLTVRASDQQALDALRRAGVNVVEFSPAQLHALADVTRKDVWPKLQGEIGPATMAALRASVGLR